ncbi:MAG: mechanosensitive ion channel family protein [Actinomycetota bacterium]
MLTETLTPWHIIAAPSFFAGGVLLGIVADALVRRRLAKRRGTITSWGGDDVIIGALRRVILVWFAIGGAWAAVFTLPIESRLANVASKILVALLVIATTIAIARVAADWVRLYALRTQGAVGSSSIFVTLVRLAIYLLGLLVLLQMLGISITPLLTALGVGGLAVALALQDTLSNLFAGIHVIGSRKVRLGDYIKIDSGEEGYVVDINWRNTSIRSLPGDVVVVPNAKLANANLTNFYQPQRETSVLARACVAYESDLEHVERVAIEVGRESMRTMRIVIPDFDPFVRFNEFGDSAIHFNVIMRVREYSDRYELLHIFIKRLHERFRAENIEIPYPVQQIIEKVPPRDGSWFERTGGAQARN